LREIVLKSKPGQKLGSIREIGKEKGVSHFTVQRAMGLLEEEGYVNRRRAIGMYSARPDGTPREERAKRRILILAPQDWYTDILSMINQVLIERGFLTLLRRYDLQDSAARWIPRVRFDGAVFFGWCSPEMVPALRKRKVPFVAQGLQYYFHPDIDSTCGDERLAGILAAKHLIRLGHKKIAVLVHEPHNPDIIERTRGFTNEARLQNVEAEVLDCKMVWGDDARLRAKKVIEERLTHVAPSFTGLFTVGDTGAASVLQACYEHGIRVPEQLSVIGLGDLPESAYLCPALTTLAFDPRDRAEAIADILERRFQGDDSQRIQKMFDPVLIERKSTAPPPKEASQ
jgi:DNA-binding LacI/PurR family transcriptional regulator